MADYPIIMTTPQDRLSVAELIEKLQSCPDKSLPVYHVVCVHEDVNRSAQAEIRNAECISGAAEEVEADVDTVTVRCWF